MAKWKGRTETGQSSIYLARQMAGQTHERKFSFLCPQMQKTYLPEGLPLGGPEERLPGWVGASPPAPPVADGAKSDLREGLTV